MKKVYLIYLILDADRFNARINLMLPTSKSFTYKNGKMFGLYAWTNKKSILSEFMEIRNMKVFKVKNIEIDEDRFDDFKLNFTEYQLSRYKYLSNSKDESSEYKEIVSTKNEYTISTMDGFTYLCDFGFKFDRDLIKPNKLTREVVTALDILGYWNIYYSTYGTESTRDCLSNSLSYGLSVMGNKAIVSEDSFTNEYLILLFLFRDLFF